jgi:hypothetical protein
LPDHPIEHRQTPDHPIGIVKAATKVRADFGGRWSVRTIERIYYEAQRANRRANAAAIARPVS